MEYVKKICLSDYSNKFLPAAEIQRIFFTIWDNITSKITVDVPNDKVARDLEQLVLYDILDGSRSTLTSLPDLDKQTDCALYVLQLIHILKSLGLTTCYIMIHTSYNRERGDTEFTYILQKIQASAPLISTYAEANDIQCFCLGMNEQYELTAMLQDVMNATKNGAFKAVFLIDYNESWAITPDAITAFQQLPDIDVCIRHTKFQISGGWIPQKMTRSVFLYSQNGTLYSNWQPDEIIAMVAISFLAKKIHADEILNKIYRSEQELTHRYQKREIELMNEKILLRSNPRKFFTIGSPQGMYQLYY